MPTQITSLRMDQKFKKTPVGEIPVDWEACEIKSIAKEFLNGGTPDTKVEKYWKGSIPWITGADFSNQKVSAIRRYITEEAVKNSATNVVPEGELLVVTRTGVGKLAIAPSAIAISQDITGLITDRKRAIPEFLLWMLDFCSQRLKAAHQGTSINGILRDDLESFIMPCPPISEQKKIAEILSAVDEAIERTDAVIEKTKQLKKGLMQDLLTRGLGHKKFKKTEVGNIPVDWESCRLGNIGRLEYGHSLPDRNRQAGHVPVYGSNGVVGVHSKASVKGPGIIIGRKGTVGAIKWADNDFWPIDTTYYISKQETSENLGWLFYLLRTLKLEKLNAATGVPGLNREQVYDLRISRPPLNEQSRIAGILSAADGKISQDEAHRQCLKQLKKALMQVLLTGKVRTR